MKIGVIGAGYVGMANALLLAKNHIIHIYDINENSINLINNGICPVEDSLGDRYLSNFKKNIKAFSAINISITQCDFCIVATPTNFDKKTKSFDTSSISEVLAQLKDLGFKGTIAIRSTLPIGFTKDAVMKFSTLNIAFLPEFLREGQALYDSLNPSRIIAGYDKPDKNIERFVEILVSNSSKKEVQILYTSSMEAESIKLFSNAYLAMRIAYFNEVDSYALKKYLNSRNIIKGISMDPRIGDYYNNPSFGYGGYCLPKDVMELSESLKEFDLPLIKNIIKSNNLRKKIISKEILKIKQKNIGIFRLAMKSGSDNFREASVLEIVKSLKINNKNLTIFEPSINRNTFLGIKIDNDLKRFIDRNELIIANRLDDNLQNVKKVIFSRDLFNIN
jgi:UDPglucose 6-dehydrogenase